MSRFFLLFIIMLMTYSAFSQNHRYTNTIFPSSDKTENIVYGAAPFLNPIYAIESDTSRGNLIMDIYQPHSDDLTIRPAIIFAHSGGFLEGNRNHDDMAAFCDTFARKGYVTATIDYRQGYYLLSNAEMHSTRAGYRGLQDGRTAVRFLRANATDYGIDTNKIYFAGSSAGAFIALNSIYMDEPSEKPVEAGAVSYSNSIPPFNHTGPDLGAYDIGNNLDHNGEPDAIIDLWGAVDDTSHITPENDQQVFLVHGTDDSVVPFNSGYPWGYSQLPLVYGSKLVYERLENIGLEGKETYFVEGADHEFYGTSNGTWENGVGGNEYWDTIVSKVTFFLWKIHKPKADFEYSANELIVDFTDLSQEAVSWNWSFGDGYTSDLQNPTHSYGSPGTYEVELYIENNIRSWDTIVYSITITQTGIRASQRGSISVYPNPASNSLFIDNLPENEKISISIYSSAGELVHKISSIKQKSARIYTSQFKPGIYFLRARSENSVLKKKIIINQKNQY